MNINEYNTMLHTYNTQWRLVTELRGKLQAANAYLASYGVTHRGDAISFLAKPVSKIDIAGWPSADQIESAVATLRTIGEETVSAFNRLSKHDQYLVKLPERM